MNVAVSFASPTEHQSQRRETLIMLPTLDATHSMDAITLPSLQWMPPMNPTNTCGECKACCSALPIVEPELQKPAGEPCKHLCATGCGIWQAPAMPKLCQDYLCAWRRDAWLGKRDWLRPDRLGIIVEFANENGKVLKLTEVTPGAFQEKQKQIEYIKQRYIGVDGVKYYPYGVLDGIHIELSEVQQGTFDGTKHGLYFEKTGHREITVRRKRQNPQ